MSWRDLVENRWAMYALLFPFFVPYSLKFIPGLSQIYDLVNVFKLLAILLILFFYITRRRLSKVMLLIFSFQGLLVLSSFLNGLREFGDYSDLLPPLGLAMLVEMGMGTEKSKVLSSLFHILASLTVINFFLTLLYPTGLSFASLYTQIRNPLYFLGQDNGLVYQLLTLLGLNYLLVEKEAGAGTVRLISGKYAKSFHPRLWLFDLIAFVTMLIVGSATGLMVLLLFWLLTRFRFVRGSRLVVWPWLTFYVGFMVLVVLAGSSIPWLSWVTELLGRDAGFTGRDLLWEQALSLIAEKPVLGWGNQSELIAIWNSYFSAHNQILDIALRAGLLGLGVFGLLHVLAFRSCQRASTKMATLIFSTLYCFLIGGLMEAGVRPNHFIFLVLAAFPYLEDRGQHFHFNLGDIYRRHRHD